MLQGRIDQYTYFRQEVNGVTFYNLRDNKYCFYKDITFDSKEDLLSIDYSQLSPSTDIKISYPFCICCLIENSCNLNCIYCFGDDKMYRFKRSDTVEQIYGPVAAMHPLQISIGGGEPTLNKQLGEIIEFFSRQEIAVLLDTNGTTDGLNKIIPVLKKNNVLVRFSIDSLDDAIINSVRPRKTGISVPESKMITDNLDMLLSNGICISVHTVLTKFNALHITDLADNLVKKGIKRWQIAAVKYSVKCKDIFKSIAVNDDMVQDCIKSLEVYRDKIDITVAYEKDFGPNSRLIVDVNGDFLTDSVLHGLNYMGKEPTLEELYRHLDANAHIKRYLGEYYLMDF